MISDKLFDYIENLPERISKKAIHTRKYAKEFELFTDKTDTLLSDAAYLYCVGNQYVSERILEKPGKLTDTEFKIIRLIPYLSYKTLEDEEIDQNIKLLCLYYHDDQPNTINGEPLPEITDIVKQRKNELYTIDAYTAMTSKRAYREALPVSQVIRILQEDEKASQEVVQFLKEQYLF